MTEYTSIVLLCEDRQQEVFARQFLESCGVDKRRIYPSTCPRGKQAGAQYVRENYPRHVVSYRQVAHRLSAGLVVLTDADTFETSERLRQLAQALQDSGVPPRDPRERIGVFIPKRNIETWIYYLQGQAVNEEDVYRHLSKPGDCKPVVRQLAQNRRQPLPENAPNSLKTACRELPRIFPEEA
jgi:hypothetical protein